MADAVADVAYPLAPFRGGGLGEASVEEGGSGGVTRGGGHGGYGMAIVIPEVVVMATEAPDALTVAVEAFVAHPTRQHVGQRRGPWWQGR